MGLILAALGRVPIWLWAVALLAGWGYMGHKQAQNMRVQALEEASRLERQNRALERESAKKVGAISNELNKAQAERNRAARSANERLSALAAEWAASAALGPACRYDAAPAAAILPEQTRNDLVDLAEEADAVAARLRACQAYVRPGK